MAEQDKTLRIIHTLQILNHRRYRTADEVQKLLSQQDHQVTKRTVERDLQSLADSQTLGPYIECNEKSRPYGWRLNRKAGLLLPSLDTDLAATWDLVGHYLDYLLPDTARHKLGPEIENARSYLQRHTQDTWNKKVAFLPRGLLRPASIAPSVRETVYDALLENCQIEAVYRTKWGDKKEARLHPLGIVHRPAVSYLVVLWNAYEDPRHLALHRLERATKTPDKARTLPGFDLSAYIRSGVFDITAGKTSECRVRLRFYQGAGEHLLESPLEPEQSIHRIDQDCLELSATTHDSYELRWWILGFGSRVEVLAPEHLRGAIAEELRASAKHYLSPG